jgi:hypothetical protein
MQKNDIFVALIKYNQMKNKILIAFFSLQIVLTFGQKKDFATELERKLFDLEGVSFKKVDSPEGYSASYQLSVRQPVNHSNPSEGYFYQKVYLNHKNYTSPTVIITEGYDMPNNRSYELSNLLEANQVGVEHRYFGESIPVGKDYKYLTLQNATADLHRINTLLRSLYPENWISTGISKGGQTTLFYRYFYPNDVDVSVPYVAPLNTGVEDKRIYSFFDNIGTKVCRDKLENVQKRLLTERDASLAKLKWYIKGAGLTFKTIPVEQMLELAVLEYPFAFWQWGGDCDAIPEAKASHDEVLDHFINASGVDLFSDRDLAKYASHYYQAGTQMGYYGYDLSKFKNLIKALPKDKNPSAVFMPNNLPIKFDDKLTNDVIKWIDAKGDEFVHIYGKNDAWTATSVKQNDARNSLWFIMEGKDHGKARIKNMSDEDQAKTISTIKKWMSDKKG